MEFQAIVMFAGISGEKDNPEPNISKSLGEEKVKNTRKVVRVWKNPYNALIKKDSNPDFCLLTSVKKQYNRERGEAGKPVSL